MRINLNLQERKIIINALAEMHEWYWSNMTELGEDIVNSELKKIKKLNDKIWGDTCRVHKTIKC